MWYKNKQKIDKQQKGEKITATWLNRCKPMYYVCGILRGLGLGRWEGRHFPMQDLDELNNLLYIKQITFLVFHFCPPFVPLI